MSKISKAVVVTGALGGIGSAICNTFKRQGWFVIPLDLRVGPSDLGDLAEFDLIRFVRNPGYRDKCVAEIQARLPKQLDRLAVVNNAAVQKLSAAERLTLDDWDETLSVNLLGPFFLSQALFNQLSSSDGRVINIGSVHAALTKEQFTAYATSKGALNNLTRSLAVEWGKFGISVNAVCPAAIKTPMLKEGFVDSPGALAALASYHPTNAIGEPTDVATVVHMLADYESKFLTGAVLDLTGGIHSVLHDPQ